MKKLISRNLVTIALAVTAMMVHAQGMQFEPQGTLFKDAVQKARQTGKHIFVDCYTSWCGPCKKMARDVFPTDSAGQFMNPRFVNLQIDMEKGEGPSLGKQWQVGAYPTFIIFDSNGVEMNRFLGGSGTAEFLNKVAASLTDKTFAQIEERYLNGERSREFLLEYVEALGKAQKSTQANEIAEQLLEGRTETFTQDKQLVDVFIKFLSNPFCPAFIHVAKSPAQLEAVVSDPRVVAFKLNNVWQRYPITLERQQDGKIVVDEEKLAKWVELMKECGVENRLQLEMDARIRLAQDKQDWAEYVRYIQTYWDNPALDVTDMQLMQWCKPFSKECNNQEAKAVVVAMLRQRIDDLKNGKRQQQTRIGNMMLPGNRVDALQRLADMMEGNTSPSL